MNGPNEICVPAAALSMGGEDGQGIAPEGGDTVEFTGRGTVRVEGENAYITPVEINGQPVMAPATAGPGQERSPQDELADLKQQAGDMPMG